MWWPLPTRGCGNVRVENISFVEERDYLKPGSVQEALDLYRKYGENAVVLAGATDVFVRKTLLRPIVIDITDTGLDTVRQEGDTLRIGACATCKQLIDQLSGGPYHAIAEAAALLGSPQIRNMATIGGNLCNASPSADCAPSLYVLDAEVVITGPSGSRVLPIRDFIVGPSRTALEQGEILEEIRVPLPDADVRTCFDKVVRTKGLDLALVNGAISLRIGEGNVLKALRVCLGAVAPTPLLLDDVLAGFEGRELTDGLIEEIAEFCAAQVTPIDDVRATKEYRRLRCKTTVERGIKRLLDENRGEE